MTLEEMREVLSRVGYPGYTFQIADATGAPWLQITCTALCNVTDVPMKWRGRKWMLSYHMTDGELVQTAFKAVLTAQEHEAREQFKYRGVSIFDPHYDVERLVALRTDPTSVKERQPG
jgi:hypothetical protein